MSASRLSVVVIIVATVLAGCGSGDGVQKLDVTSLGTLQLGNGTSSAISVDVSGSDTTIRDQNVPANGTTDIELLPGDYTLTVDDSQTFSTSIQSGQTTTFTYSGTLAAAASGVPATVQ